MLKEEMIDELVEDYQCYLLDMTVPELKKIIKNSVFTLREARREEHRKDLLK